MHCPQCGHRVKVINSRTVESTKKVFYANARLIEKAQEAVGWYTPDWVARHRKCAKCGWEKFSVEVLIEDLEEMKRLIASGEANDQV